MGSGRSDRVARTLAAARAAAALLLAAAFSVSCQQVREQVEELLDSRTPRERYVDHLHAAGLQGTALASDWVAASQRALLNPHPVTSPHLEHGVFPLAEPTALGWRVPALRGQQLHFEVALSGDSTTRIFVEVYTDDAEPGEEPELLLATDGSQRTVRINARRDTEYLIYAQPELLRGGRYTASVRTGPSLAFPVEGGRERDIGSVFGDARDGGARRHHGIDIFAPRGTPVVAAAAGTVYRVQTTPVGGNVIWVRDTSGARQYYAHLDRHNVAQGDTVQVGDIIGFVGNTGNARSTPPHLHFGVYARGPVDPHWYVRTPRGSLPALVADTARLGEWARVRSAGADVRISPAERAPTLRALPASSAVRVVAAVGKWFRVRIPDGTTGYLDAAATEGVLHPIDVTSMPTPVSVFLRATDSRDGGNLISHELHNAPLEVLGRFEAFLLVRTGEVEGWVREGDL